MSTAPLGIGSQLCTVPAHIAFFYRGRQDLRDVVARFMGAGLDDPDQALYFFGVRGVPAALMRDFAVDVGRDLAEDIRIGRIVFGESSVEADMQLDRILAPVAKLAERFRLIRLIGVVGWDSPAFPYPEDFLWFESKLNDAIGSLPVIILCAYDTLGFAARALIHGGIETHPLVLSAGILSANPQFVPADRYFRTRLLSLPWLDQPRR